MITKVPYSVIMGKAVNDNSYLRYSLKSENEHQNKILEYGDGLFFCFKTKSKSIKLRYNCYVKNSVPDRFPKYLCWYSVLMGKLNNNWIYLNENSQNSITLPQKSDLIHNININTKLNKTYDEYQVCLPPICKIYDIDIESDEPIEFVFVKNEVILLGSSISQDCNSSVHMNLCCYLYRKFGINVACLGISQYHTFLNKKLCSELNAMKNKKFIVVDLEHLSLEQYKSVEHFAKKCKYLVLDSVVFNFAKNIKKYNNEIELLSLNGDFLYDGRHFNDFGTARYALELKKRNLI